MFNFIMSFIIAMVAALTPWSAFAATLDLTKADQLIKKYNVVYEKPKSCPMESKKYSDLIAKIEAIKDVLKGNCLKKDSDKMTEVLDSIKGIQDELKNQSAFSNVDGVSTVTDALGTVIGGNTITTTSESKTIDGVKYSKLFSNITTMFKKNQCNMEDGRVLEMTADLIYDSTQLGAISGSKMGLIVAGSGFLISSALRLIDLLIKKKFDFDKPVDRQSFVKLNCSFYEIRRDLDAQGAFDVENNSNREDYRDVKAIIEELTAELKKLDEDKANIAKANVEIDRATFETNIGDVSELQKLMSKMLKYLQPGITISDLPSETQKLLMISQIAQDYDSIVNQVKLYKNLRISSIPMLDDLFINELKKFDSLDPVAFTATMEISAKDFNDKYRAIILFHILRIDADLAKKGMSLSEKSNKAKLEHVTGVDKRKLDYTAKLLELKKIENKLGNIVAPKEYSGLDDGSENMVSILDNHKTISSQLYGEWGEKFLKYSTYKSMDETKEFNNRLSLFNAKYTEVIKGSKVPLNYFCQDAQKIRLLYRHADSLIQEGFDFLATNKDIIYSDVKNHYNGTINEDDDKVGANGPIEKVQRHYKSAVLAVRKIKGETISEDDRSKYLDKNGFGNYYIGRSMLEVSQAKARTKTIQELFEKNNCQKSLVSDIE
jgi:hypothetical protein